MLSSEDAMAFNHFGLRYNLLSSVDNSSNFIRHDHDYVIYTEDHQ